MTSMPVQCRSFATPSQLREILFDHPADGTLHVAASRRVREGLDALEREGILPENSVKAFRDLEQRALPGWNDVGLKVLQHALVRGQARRFIGGSGSGEPFRRLHDGAGPATSALRLCLEAGLRPRDLNVEPGDEDLLRFRELWDCIDEQFRALGGASSDPLGLSREDPRSVKQRVFRGNAPERVVLHGFHFVTSLQYRLLEQLAGAGIALEFLAHRHPDYHQVFRAWSAFFGEGASVGMLPAPQPCAAPPGAVGPAAELLGRLLEGEPLAQVREGPAALHPIGVPNLVALERETRGSADRPVRVYVAGRAGLADHLARLDPQRPILVVGDLPGGKRLRLLCSLPWVEVGVEEQPQLDTRSVRDWLSADGEAVRCGLLEAVSKLASAFEDCRTVGDWIARCDRLIARAGAGLLDEPTPLLRADLTVSGEQIGRLRGQLEGLQSAIRAMNAGGESWEDRLSQVVECLAPEPSGRALWKVLIRGRRALRIPEHVRGADLAMALATALDGPVPTPCAESAQQQPPRFQSWSDLDGLVYEHAATGGQFDLDVHLALVDSDHLPAPPWKPPWPITAEALPTGLPAAELVRLRIQEAAAVATMLLWQGLAWGGEGVIVSWCTRRDGTARRPSPFLLAPRGAEDGPPSPPDGAPDTERWEAEREAAQELFRGLLEERLPTCDDYDEIDPENRLRMALKDDLWKVCPRLAVYALVLKDFPAFRDRIHRYRQLRAVLSLATARTFRPDWKLTLARELEPGWPEARLLGAWRDGMGWRPARREGDEEGAGGVRPRQLALIDVMERESGLELDRAQDDEPAPALAMQGLGALPPGRAGGHCYWCPERHRCPERGTQPPPHQRRRGTDEEETP